MPERELKVRLSADAQRFRSGMRNAESSFLSLRAAVAAGGAAIAAGIGMATREAVQFESSMAGVAKTVDASDQTIRLLGDRFQDLSNRIPVAANELAALGQTAGQLGVQVRNIEAFVETTAKLGTAVDGLTADEAATQLARFVNVAGTSQDQFENLASSLVQLGNNVAANEAEILNFAKNLVAAGSQIGLTEAEILGLSGSMVALGANAEAASTALQRAFIGMQDAVRSGGEELRAFASVAGMSGEEFARVFREDASEAISAFFAGIQRANEEGKSLTAVMESMDLQSERTIRALLKAARASDQLEGNMAMATEAFRQNVALQEEAERRFETTASDLQKARNNLQTFAQDMGEFFAPSLRRGSELLAGMGDLLDGLGNKASAAGPGVARLREQLDGLALSAERMNASQINAQVIALTERLQELQGQFNALEGGSMFGARMQALQGVPGLDWLADISTSEAGQARKAIRQQVEAIQESLDTLQTLRRQLGESGEEADDAAGGTDRLSDGLDRVRASAAGAAGSLRTVEELYREIVGLRTGPLPTQLDQLTGEAISENIMSDAEIERLRAGLSRVGEEVEKQAEEPMGELERTLKEGGKRAGEALIEGIILGGESMGDTLKRFMARLASTFIMSQLTGFLGIGSPSKKGMWVGEMLSEGVALGIERRGPRVASASRGVAARAERAMLRRGRGGSSGPGAGSGVRVVEFRNVPDPPTPADPEVRAERSYWQRLLRRGIEVAEREGFEVGGRRSPVRRKT